MAKHPKIKVKGTLVVLHGDEMAQVAFDSILDRFIRKRLDISLDEIDLSADNRLKTNGKIVEKAIASLKRHGVGVKNAGITVNKAQKEALLKKYSTIDGNKLHPLATKSPNGAIRKGIAGNITREDIPFINLRRILPEWKGRDIDVMTMDEGGLKSSYNEISQKTGILKLLFVGNDGKPRELHRRRINKGDPWLITTNEIENVRQWAHAFFQRALDEKRDAYMGLKDTVIPGYDGVMRTAAEEVYREHFEAKFKKAKLAYHYGLIDAQAAQMIVHPPKRALWGVPDNNSGRKMHKLVEMLKIHGLPDRPHQAAISRMSAGGGDQYGSFNTPADEDGILKVELDGKERHARDVKKGDPILMMSNEHSAIKEWVYQIFRDAAAKEQEIYIGLKREYMKYDDLFSDIINEVRIELSEGGKALPSFMIMRPSKQIQKMIVDPPINARYPSQNLDGDIFSDIAAALGGSLATASSIIESASGTMLFEAPHGTAPDLYETYQKTKGKQAYFNSAALLYAFANALEVIASRELNEALGCYAADIKKALIRTVEDGIITGDLKGKTTKPSKETIVDMHGFLDAVEERLGC